MSSSKSNVYVPKKSNEGKDVFCPIDENADPQMTIADDDEACVEQDVVGRYAGNIDVRSVPDKPDSR